MQNKIINTGIIIQARFNSSRLKGKVMTKINGKFILEIIVKRLTRNNFSKRNIIIACTNNKEDNAIRNFCKKNQIKYFAGSEKNVLKRYYFAAKKFNLKNIIRITSDCPCIDLKIVKKIYDIFNKGKFDYVSNTINPTFPDGLDAEIFNFKSLKLAYSQAKSEYDLEHVTPFIKRHKNLKKFNLLNNKDLSKIRLTLDVEEDLKTLKIIFNYFKPDIFFSFEDLKKLINLQPKFFLENNQMRNFGSLNGSGQKLWAKAKRIIPGGNMLLSKNPSRFHPNGWPTYYSKAKGSDIWDLDGKKYRDLSLMGVGTNILGYSNNLIDQAVIRALTKGNMSTLNCSEEVKLAERLLEIAPTMEMVKFARSGGEANAIAIRIARASSGKDNVAVCGYHGWHDWYLAMSINKSKDLEKNLVSGIDKRGVPKSLKNSIYSFNYNDFESLENLVREKNIGVIKMEVKRNIEPKNNFLRKIQNLAKKKNIVLVFDECSSGFRETFGGIYKKYNLDPDMVIFGKALGNGYAITSVLGKKNIMENAEKTFISSTFWTERIGPSAALKTLEIMEKKKSWIEITTLGKKIKKRWLELAKNNNIKIDTWGIDAMPGFSFKSKNNNIYKTFITQEMLKKRILASNNIYCSIAHNEKIFNNYFTHLDRIFNQIYKFENDHLDPRSFLEGPESITGLNRFN